jgi:hypothetical protein
VLLSSPALYRYVIQGLTTNELADNYYKLFPDGPPTGNVQSNITLFGNLDNVTNMFLFERGADLASDGDANQAATLLNLVSLSRPSRNIEWNNSFIRELANFIDCGMQNDCFADPVQWNFMRCFVINIPRPAPCKDEFDAAAGALVGGGQGIFQCLANPLGDNEGTIETEDQFNSLTAAIQDNMVLCLLNLMLPAGALERTLTQVGSLVKTISGVGAVVVNVTETLQKGLPGEVILFVFGWAVFQDGELVAPYKWWYCLFAVSMFIVGIEVVKLFGTRFIVWTNR